MCDTTSKNLEVIRKKLKEINDKKSDTRLQELLAQIEKYLEEELETEKNAGWICPKCRRVINPWYSYCPFCCWEYGSPYDYYPDQLYTIPCDFIEIIYTVSDGN